MMEDAAIVLTWPNDLQSVDASMAPIRQSRLRIRTDLPSSIMDLVAIEDRCTRMVRLGIEGQVRTYK